MGLYTGKIHMMHTLDKVDALRLPVLVKDEGEPALTAMATVLEDSSRVPKGSLWALTGFAGAEMVLMDVNVYVIIAICVVSSLWMSCCCCTWRCGAPCCPARVHVVHEAQAGVLHHGGELVLLSADTAEGGCSGEGPPNTNLMAFSSVFVQVWTRWEEMNIQKQIRIFLVM